jgi:hypothetical protein
MAKTLLALLVVRVESLLVGFQLFYSIPDNEEGFAYRGGTAVFASLLPYISTHESWRTTADSA